MLPDEVRKAVEAVESHADDMTRCIGVLHAYKGMRPVEVEFSKAADELKASALTIRAHLLAREAEVEMLRAPFSDEDATAGSHWFGEWVTWKRRCDRAEALLRECRRFVAWASERLPEALPIYEKLDAHLSENSRG